MSFLSGSSIGIRLALKAHFLPIALGFMGFMLLAAVLAAQFSGRQPASVALDVGLSVMRLALPLVMVLVVQELISREFERRYYLSSLSFPLTRARFLLSRFGSAMVLCLAALLVWSVALALTVWVVSQAYEQASPVALGGHYVVTVLFIGLDILLLLALATLLAVTASTPSFVLIGTFGFMWVARSYGTIIELLTRNSSVVGDAEQYRAGLGMLGYLLPDMGALDVRMITLYGRMEFLPQDWPLLVLSCLGYTAGLLALAVWALNRKRFA
jgi:Cu-processing system permease protein